MQYVLIDAHRRFLGTLNSEKVLAVGDTFQNHNDQAYMVVGLNWFKQGPSTQSLTVIPASNLQKLVEQN